jgi:hypothetical protein
LPQRESNIGEDAFGRWPLPHFAAALLHQAHVAECPPSRLLGFGARHALTYQFVGALRNVLADRDSQVVIAATAKELAQKDHGRSPTSWQRRARA